MCITVTLTFFDNLSYAILFNTNRLEWIDVGERSQSLRSHRQLCSPQPSAVWWCPGSPWLQPGAADGRPPHRLHLHLRQTSAAASPTERDSEANRFLDGVDRIPLFWIWNWLMCAIYLLVAVITGDMKRGEKHCILDIHISSMLQKYICCLTGGEMARG